MELSPRCTHNHDLAHRHRGGHCCLVSTQSSRIPGGMFSLQPASEPALSLSLSQHIKPPTLNFIASQIQHHHTPHTTPESHHTSRIELFEPFCPFSLSKAACPQAHRSSAACFLPTWCFVLCVPRRRQQAAGLCVCVLWMYPR